MNVTVEVCLPVDGHCMDFKYYAPTQWASEVSWSLASASGSAYDVYMSCPAGASSNGQPPLCPGNGHDGSAYQSFSIGSACGNANVRRLGEKPTPPSKEEQRRRMNANLQKIITHGLPKKFQDAKKKVLPLSGAKRMQDPEMRKEIIAKHPLAVAQERGTLVEGSTGAPEDKKVRKLF